MKNLISILLISCFGFTCSAQKIFSVQYANQAGKNDGKWFFTEYENQAKKKIYYVDYQNQADLKIYFVEYENQAGWRNKAKQHLLY